MNDAINKSGRQRMLSQLEVFVPTQDISAGSMHLAQSWSSYKEVLAGATPKQRDVQKVLTMNEELFVMAQELTDQLKKFSATAAGKVNNLAGRQRMLSQRMAKFYQALQCGAPRLAIRPASRTLDGGLMENPG